MYFSCLFSVAMTKISKTEDFIKNRSIFNSRVVAVGKSQNAKLAKACLLHDNMAEGAYHETEQGCQCGSPTKPSVPPSVSPQVSHPDELI